MENKKLGQLQDSLTSLSESKKLTLSGKLRHYKIGFANSGLQIQQSTSNGSDRFQDLNRKELSNQIGMLVSQEQENKLNEEPSNESTICLDITLDERLFYISSKLNYLKQITSSHKNYFFSEQYHYLLLKYKLCTIIRYKKYQAKRNSLIHMLILFRQAIIKHQHLLKDAVQPRFRPIQRNNRLLVAQLETHRMYLMRAKLLALKTKIKELRPIFTNNYSALVQQLTD